MNKKIALFLFAIGLGASAAQAADSCGWSCLREYQACMRSGAAEIDCIDERLDCTARCGI